MAFIPAPNCVQIAVLGNQAGQPCEMTVGAVFPDAYELSDLEALALQVDGWVNEEFLVLIGSDAMYEGISIRGLSSIEDLEENLSEPLPGGSGSVALPANVAYCITKRTGVTGRSARGRMYAFAVPADAAEDVRHLSAAYQTAYQDAWDTLTGYITTAGFAPVVISYYTEGAPRVTASIRLITSFQARDTRLDTQRRRLGASE